MEFMFVKCVIKVYNLAKVLPRLAGMVGGGKDLQQAFDLRHGGAGELLGIGEEDGGRGRAVLGLAEDEGLPRAALMP